MQISTYYQFWTPASLALLSWIPLPHPLGPTVPTMQVNFPLKIYQNIYNFLETFLFLFSFNFIQTRKIFVRCLWNLQKNLLRRGPMQYAIKSGFAIFLSWLLHLFRYDSIPLGGWRCRCMILTPFNKISLLRSYIGMLRPQGSVSGV